MSFETKFVPRVMPSEKKESVTKRNDSQQVLDAIKTGKIDIVLKNLKKYEGLDLAVYDTLLKKSPIASFSIYNNLSSFGEGSLPIHLLSVFSENNKNKEELKKNINRFIDPLKNANTIINQLGKEGVDYVADNVKNLSSLSFSSDDLTEHNINQLNAISLLHFGKDEMNAFVSYDREDAIMASPEIFKSSLVPKNAEYGLAQTNNVEFIKFIIDNFPAFKEPARYGEPEKVIGSQTLYKKRYVNESSTTGGDYKYRSWVEKEPSFNDLAKILVNRGYGDLVQENIDKFKNDRDGLSQWELDQIKKEYEEKEKN